MNLLESYKSQIDILCENFKVKSLFAFGSILTNRFDDSSDIDLLVEFYPIELMDYSDNYFDFKFKLEDLLNRKIHLIEYKAIKNPYFKESVDQQKQIVYGYQNQDLVI
jgi:hypothetical protein